MHPHLTEVFARLDEARSKLRAAVEAVPAPLRGQPPAAERWSVTDVLEHLSLVEQRFTAVIAERIDEARKAGLGPELTARTALPASIERQMGDRENRRTAPEVVRPGRVIDDVTAWAAVERARASFRATVIAADGLALSEVIHAHPFFGALNIYQWVELIAAHEARHTQQIREIARQYNAGGETRDS